MKGYIHQFAAATTLSVTHPWCKLTHRQGIKPVNHARNNLAAIQAQSEKSRALKKQQEEAALAAQRSRPASAASVRSSGYASPHYTPRWVQTTVSDQAMEKKQSNWFKIQPTIILVGISRELCAL
jgi:hypothetical protein